MTGRTLRLSRAVEDPHDRTLRLSRTAEYLPPAHWNRCNWVASDADAPYWRCNRALIVPDQFFEQEPFAGFGGCS